MFFSRVVSTQKDISKQLAGWWFFLTFLRTCFSYPKNPDPSKVAILRTQKHPCYTGSFTRTHWRVQPGILRVPKIGGNWILKLIPHFLTSHVFFNMGWFTQKTTVTYRYGVYPARITRFALNFFQVIEWRTAATT